jgi:hypothetical protein
MEELYTIELTSSQLKTLNTAFAYASILFEGKSYHRKEREDLLLLIDAIKMQTIEGSEI